MDHRQRGTARLVAAAAAAAFLVIVPPLQPRADAALLSFTICHRAPGRPENAHTLTVTYKALPTHLYHGDTLGACPTG